MPLKIYETFSMSYDYENTHGCPNRVITHTKKVWKKISPISYKMYAHIHEGLHNND